MLNLIMARLLDPMFMAMMLAAIAAGAAVLTVGMPLLERNMLKNRMNAVAIEREKIRTRERERLVRDGQRTSLRSEPKAYMKRIVDRFKLGDWLGTDTAKLRLAMAGYRGKSAEIGFLFFRLVTPIVLFLVTLFYVFVVLKLDQPPVARVGMAILAAYIGIKAPEIYVSNIIAKRQFSIKRAFPDALDLMLICVESGMSIEQAFRKVSQEIGGQSIPLAEELTLTTAELSFLQDRRQAFDNLGNRVGLDGVKSICTALVQAERYGTPVGSALRTLSQENRDQRMQEAEKKAAALPPQLTVPMILFFLPVLFAVILTPALIQIFHWD
jgi:tight adherence protein C